MENDIKGEFLIYQENDGESKVTVRIEDDTVWVTQMGMSELFDVSKQNISYHLKNIFSGGELDINSVVKEILTTANDGKVYQVQYYNLDAIISVGYRVNSKRATQFRQWATKILKEYMIKGFALDDERLKGNGGGNYWKELLDRIRDIRSSEKMMYRQVLDLYATSTDYDAKAPETIQFFKVVQNKLHYATHGNTASEVIYNRANADKPFMGLTTFTGEMPTLKDSKIAKNYLSGEELRILSNIVSAYFDLAELRATRHIPTTMKEYIELLDNIIKANGDKVLIDSGKISHKQAMNKAEKEYRKYQVNTLSPIEKEYLETITNLNAIAKKKSKE